MAGNLDYSAYLDRLELMCKEIVDAPVMKYAPESGSPHLPFWVIALTVTDISRITYNTYRYQLTAEIYLVRTRLNNVDIATDIQQVHADIEAILNYIEDKLDFRTSEAASKISGMVGQATVNEVGVLVQAGGSGSYFGSRAVMTWTHQTTKDSQTT